MPSPQHFAELFAHHFDSLEKLAKLAVKLPDEERLHQPGYGRGSIQDLLFHVLNSDYGWRIGLQTGARPEPLATAEHQSVQQVLDRLDDERRHWTSMLDEMSPAMIDEPVEMTSGGRSFEIERWRVLQHVLLHGMQHMSELAQVLTGYGHSPGDLDFIFYRHQNS